MVAKNNENIQKVVKKALMPVAGFGTRFLPATKAQPKEMLSLVDKPVIQYLVEEVSNSGIKEIIFVTGRGKRAIEDHFDFSFELEYILHKKGKKDLLKKILPIPKLAKFSYVRQPQPLGNGDAILRAKHLIRNEPVAVVFGDDLTISNPPLLSRLIKAYNKFSAPIVSLYKIPLKDTKRYGVVDGIKIEKNIYKINKVVEKPRNNPPSNLIIIGEFIITPKVISYIEKLAKIIKKKKSNKEIGLAEALSLYIKDGYPVYGYLFEGERYDCGNKIGFLQATVSLALKNKETKDDFKKFLKEIVKKI